MKKEYLEKCIQIFTIWEDDDFNDVAKNLNALKIFKHDMYISIGSEIHDNLLEKESTQGKIDVIRYYIYTLKGFQSLYLPIGKFLYPEINELPAIYTATQAEFDEDPTKYENEIKVLTSDEVKLRTSWFLWDAIFSYLQQSCEMFKIDYFYICVEMGFSKSMQFYSRSKYNKFNKVRKFCTTDENLRSIPVKTEAYTLLKKTKVKEKIELSLSMIALLYLYEGSSITRKNGNEIAEKYGHNSGEKLFQNFAKYTSRQNRIGLEQTRQKNLNKLNLFEKIIPLLSEMSKQKAIDELNSLKGAFENEYQ